MDSQKIVEERPFRDLTLELLDIYSFLTELSLNMHLSFEVGHDSACRLRDVNRQTRSQARYY